MSDFSTGIPNIRVVIRENTDDNLALDVPSISVNIQKNTDYNVNIVPTAVTPIRTGSWNRIADVALTAISSSYALTASYALNAGAGSGFPFSGSAVITGSLLVSQSGVTVTGSLQVDGPITATSITSSLFGTASVAAGIDVIFAGVYQTGSGSYIIPTPSGGLSYITSASYAITASYALNAVSIPAGTISSSTQVISALPAGTVSSSVQINTGSFTGSFTGSLLGTSSWASNVLSSSYAATASYFEGTIQGIQEELILSSSVGATTSSFDFANASIFYLNGMTGTGVWNIINVPTSSQKATTFTFIIEQGATAYSASAYQLNSSNISVKWLGTTVPTGSANKTDVIGLTAFRSGSTWNVLGALSSFG